MAQIQWVTNFRMRRVSLQFCGQESGRRRSQRHIPVAGAAILNSHVASTAIVLLVFYAFRPSCPVAGYRYKYNTWYHAPRILVLRLRSRKFRAPLSLRCAQNRQSSFLFELHARVGARSGDESSKCLPRLHAGEVSMHHWPQNPLKFLKNPAAHRLCHIRAVSLRYNFRGIHNFEIYKCCVSYKNHSNDELRVRSQEKFRVLCLNLDISCAISRCCPWSAEFQNPNF